MSHFYEDVLEFNAKFQLPHFGDGTSPKILDTETLRYRYEFLREELNEFFSACIVEDLAGATDGLVDLVYVALGTAAMMGLDFNAHWNLVHHANLTKVRVASADDPRSVRQHQYDVVKPSHWVAPNHEPILERTRQRWLKK